MAEPLRHRQTKGAETDMPRLPPPRHIPTLPRLCENLVICLISSGKGRYGHGVQRLAPSSAGQAKIASYKVEGQQLFFPDYRKP